MQDEQFLYLVMDFHPGGDLFSLLERYDGKFSEEMCRFYLSEVAVAVHTLHNMGYVHRYVGYFFIKKCIFSFKDFKLSNYLVEFYIGISK